MKILAPIRRIIAMPGAISSLIRELQETREYQENVARQHNALCTVVERQGREIVKLTKRVKELEEWDPDKTTPGRKSEPWRPRHG